MKLRTALPLVLALGIRPAFGAGADSPAVPILQYQAKVVDPNGQPISGAIIERYEDPDWRMGGGANPRLADRGIANAQGNVTFTRTHRTAFTLVASKPGLAIAWTGWNPQLSLDEDPVELTLTAPASISGVVQDAGGKPVADAEVWVMLAYRKGKQAVYGEWSPLNNLLGRRLLATRTTAEGRFRLEGMPQDTTLDLAVAKAGLALELQAQSFFAGSPSLSYRAGQSDLRLTVKPTGAIEGQVVEEATGTPLAGARIQATVMGSGNYLPAAPLTGADGRFRFADLGAGEYELRATIGTNALPDWVCENVPVTVKSGVTHGDVKITANQGSIVEVTVRDHHDAPFKDAPVTAVNESASQSAQTTDQGVARLRLTPGEYTVFTQIAGFSGEPIQVTCERGQTQRLAYALAPTPRFTGTVVDPQGQPARNLPVSLFPDLQGERRTDAEGRFTLTVEPSQFDGMRNTPRILIVRDLARNLAASLEVDEDSTNASLKLEPGLTLAGRVTDAKGNGIAKAEAHLILQAGIMGRALGQPVPTDLEGRFEIKGLPPGRNYSVTVVAKGYGTAGRYLGTTNPTARRMDLDRFQLPVADQRIAGVVVDDEDKPVPGATISAYGNGQPNVSGQTDAKGRFAFDPVCAGPINVYANSQQGNASGNGSTVAQGGDTHITVRFGVHQRPGEMSSAGTRITGTIVDPDGKPAPGVLVSLLPDPQGEKTADAEGRFKLTFDPSRFEGMPIGQRVVIARDLIRNLAAALDLEEGATNAGLKLQPAWTLAGRIVDANGIGIAGGQAQLMFDNDHFTSLIGAPTRADAGGRFEIKGLPHGRAFSVLISAPGFGQDTPDIDPPAGDARRVELEPTELLVADQRIAGVVLDADDKPVAGTWINGSGDKQPTFNAQTDSKGRFAFKPVCSGPLRLYASNQQGLTGTAHIEGGDTNITLRIAAARAEGERTPSPPVASLEGKPMPDLTALGLAGGDVPAKGPLLALVIDVEQRPSRRVLKRMTELADTLKQKGLTVIVLQAGALEGAEFAAWQQENAIPFPVGLFQGNREKARAAWGAAALPWLILTDADHMVTAEGFAIGELDEKIESMKK